MGSKRAPRVWLQALLVLFLLVACSRELEEGQGSAGASSERILFIGNSYTFFNEGVDKELEGLAPAATTSRIAVAGYSLEDHWKDGKALDTIRNGSWEFVVLQEQSQRPVLDPAGFYRYSREFDTAIRASGAKTILFMTWERPDSVAFGVTTANLATAYADVATRIGAQVAPAGQAFARSLLERPGLSLNGQDGHPTPNGTYLAACVLYGAIFQATPVGMKYVPRGLTAEDAEYLRRIAAEALGY